MWGTQGLSQRQRLGRGLSLFFLEGDLVSSEDALAFLYGDGLVGCQVFERVFVTAGPGYGQMHFSVGVGLA